MLGALAKVASYWLVASAGACVGFAAAAALSCGRPHGTCGTCDHARTETHTGDEHLVCWAGSSGAKVDAGDGCGRWEPRC